MQTKEPAGWTVTDTDVLALLARATAAVTPPLISATAVWLGKVLKLIPLDPVIM